MNTAMNYEILKKDIKVLKLANERLLAALVEAVNQRDLILEFKGAGRVEGSRESFNRKLQEILGDEYDIE